MYPARNQPEGLIYLAGEHVSYVNAWQQGAVRSAQIVCEAIHARVGQA